MAGGGEGGIVTEQLSRIDSGWRPGIPGKDRRRFHRGEPVRTIAELAVAIESEQWLFLNHKPMHFGFLCGMSFRALANFVRRGRIFYAIDTKPEPKP